MRESVMLLPLHRATRITEVLRSQEEAQEATMGLRRVRVCWSKNWPANGKVVRLVTLRSRKIIAEYW